MIVELGWGQGRKFGGVAPAMSSGWSSDRPIGCWGAE